ncbi:hypothetical protein DSM112329_04869 [Paraconexibacter sp. AEG42_29]|uniref:Halobacterial output domain-containing protein n=1 Tax=Paraconexibacter sp. AEG42_29 TaxID=2997339 RepID=A0AAU7B1U6_9ACTN
MTTITPTPIHHTVTDDRLLDAARSRRQLTDTALSATDAESVTELYEDHIDRELWHAVVRHADGSRMHVRLDRRLGTVVVHDARLGTTQAA